MSEGSAYQHFSSIYDVLMAEAPYEQWLRYFEVKKIQKGLNEKDILDVGCGTGTFAIQLAERGYQVTGIDLSEDMLTIAADKALEKGQTITFLQQDMRALELGQTFSVVTAFCDCINYLETYEDVESAFSSIYNHLEYGGLFLFDVHSVFKMDHIFTDATFCSQDPDISYIWECFEGRYDHSVEHELSFFVQEESGLYQRYDEMHNQRTFEVKDYIRALEKIGFMVDAVEGDFKAGQLANVEAERLFFTCLKQK